MHQPLVALEDPPDQAAIAEEEQELCFGSFRLYGDGSLFRGNTAIHLPPKELAALRLLLSYAGQIVSLQELKQQLWGDVSVTGDSIPKCISSLRSRLEPDNCIQTIYKRGYRFSAAVRPVEREPIAKPLRLAIMPFATGYAVPDHLGLAVAEETTTHLVNAHSAAVSVLARDSVFTLTQSGMTAQQLGEALKADLVLTGSLTALVGHYRLRAEMVRVEDGTGMWVEDILVPKTQIAGLETELINRLSFRLGSARIGHATAEEQVPRNLEAYETFQRARYEWQTLQRHRMQDGLHHLSRATELDPSLIAAKVDLAHLCVTQSFYGFMPPSVAAELVHRTADSVPELPYLAEGILPALGWVNFHWDHDLPAAVLAFSLSSHLHRNPWANRAQTMFELSRHRFSDAIRRLHAALNEDPYSPWLHNRLAWALHLDGQTEASMDQARKGISLFPGHEGTSLYGAMILAFNGETEQAVSLAAELARRLPYFDLATAVHAYALAVAGQGDEAHSILERLQWLSRERFVLRSFTPAAYVALGENETALAELRMAEENRCPWYFQMLADPRLEQLHGEPDFQRMISAFDRLEATASEELSPVL